MLTEHGGVNIPGYAEKVAQGGADVDEVVALAAHKLRQRGKSGLQNAPPPPPPPPPPRQAGEPAQSTVKRRSEARLARVSSRKVASSRWSVDQSIAS